MHYSAKLDATSPLKVLARGYSVVFDENMMTVRSVNDIKENDRISIRLSDGTVECIVEEKKGNESMEMYTLDTAMIRLKEISEMLQSGEYDLDMSIKLYEAGVQIVSFCNKTLTAAKQKITELSELTFEDETDE